ncbi:hypothetical protein CSOJ01_10709 [Colletotrichum sojae]|uniref:Uncharacterized protein n=1 Tax=Colletotrichum sojae TaxID=2175907 RepID=A0A8H6MPN7_9PEZI|nr:hypothetical protein CSOJ01_10709 [Colletotrichum sojae]
MAWMEDLVELDLGEPLPTPSDTTKLSSTQRLDSCGGRDQKATQGTNTHTTPPPSSRAGHPSPAIPTYNSHRQDSFQAKYAGRPSVTARGFGAWGLSRLTGGFPLRTQCSARVRQDGREVGDCENSDDSDE